MMMSRAMSQRSVMIRPATQETGGMMQYLLTIVVLIIVFWAVALGVWFAFVRKPAAKTTTDADVTPDDKCSSPVTGVMEDNLLPGKQIICSVASAKAQDLYVKIPGGICHIFVATDLVQSGGTIIGVTAFHVEYLRAINKGDALVSVGYKVLMDNEATFISSLNTFMKGPQHRIGRSFTGIEVRGIPLEAVGNATAMTQLDAAIGRVQSAMQTASAMRLTDVMVIATVDILPSRAPGTAIPKPNLPKVKTLVAFVHHTCSNSPLTARVPNDLTRISALRTDLSGWGNPCLSVYMGGLRYEGAAGWNQPATSCTPLNYCEATKLNGAQDSTTMSVTRLENAKAIAYDSVNTMQTKVAGLSSSKCIYADHIEFDEQDCKCSGRSARFNAFPLLTAVRGGMT